MTEFSLLSAQVRAARSLLNWSQSYLAVGCMVSRSTIADLEANKRQPHESSLYIIISELTAAGIVFTDRGVEFSEIPPKEYVPIGIKQKASQGN